MTTKLTTTTGTVKGEQECKDFRRMAFANFNEVIIANCFGTSPERGNYIQYTLLTNNRIKIYQ